MIALDTNALVRLAVNDMPIERAAVVALMQGERTLILKTVLLETEWVLRSRYGYAPGDVAGYFDWLAGLESTELEDADEVAAAIRHFRKGLDFADALHMASARAIPLLTLDKNFVRRAAKLGGDVRLIKAA